MAVPKTLLQYFSQQSACKLSRNKPLNIFRIKPKLVVTQGALFGTTVND